MKHFIFKLAMCHTLTACGDFQVTHEHFSSDIPGLTARVAPRVIATSLANCPTYGGIDTSYRLKSTDLRLLNDTVAFRCTL